MIPVGPGMFIWMPDRCGTPEQVATDAVAAGFKWIAFKICDGVAMGDGRNNPPDLAPYIQALRGKGVYVAGWGYVYSGGALETQTAVEAINKHQIDCFLIDAETEAKKAQPGNLSMYARRVKETGATIGLCSFRWPSLHQDFPWSAFLPYVDFHAPQVYWEQAHNPAQQLRRSVTELQKLKDIPVIPVGAAYPHGSWEPTTTEIREFIDTVEALNLPGYTWWEWYYAHNRPEWWKVITQDVTPPPTDPDLSATVGELMLRVAALEQTLNKVKAAL